MTVHSSQSGTTNLKSRSVFVSAGEQSGDLHASDLISSIKKLIPEIRFFGLGGDLMKNEGMNLLYHINELSTIGFIDVVQKIGYFKQVLKDCVEYVKENEPDIIVLIDYPGFNLRFAEEVRKFYKKKIIYYISPQLWAWHEKRAYIIKKYIDKMLVVFPFEVNFYTKYEIEAIYVGHPLTSRIKKFLSRNQKQKKVFGDEKTVTILPGSRKDEITNHLPVLINTAKQLIKEFDLKVNISKATGLIGDGFSKFEGVLGDFNLTSDNVYNLILNSDLVLTKAGTSTIECALIGTPFLIFYRTNPLNFHLLKSVVKVNKLGMVNILAGKIIINEFIQNNFTPENLLLESRKILTDNVYSNNLMKTLKQIWNILGEQDASANAAKIITSLMQV
jgi:lipid-A-disaccharide synthase